MILPDEALKLLQPELEKIGLSGEPAELYEPIRYILSLGGKRLRPVLTLMACSMYNRDLSPALPSSLAIEVFHNFTLLHDDIMDHAPLRRNKPTVHEKWNTNVAILSGDAMLIKAYELLSATDGKLLPEVLMVFNQTALGVCEGQQYDMNFESQQQVTEQEYLRMIELKTAILLAAALKTGGLCGGAPPQDLNLLYDAGRFMGMAFQLQDDYLDTFGSAADFGKTIGGDIAENKKTWLYIKALELADKKDQQFLLEMYKPGFQDRTRKIQEVTAIFTKYQIDRMASEKVNNYSKMAVQTFEKCAVEKEAKMLFTAMVEHLMGRKA